MNTSEKISVNLMMTFFPFLISWKTFIAETYKKKIESICNSRKWPHNIHILS